MEQSVWVYIGIVIALIGIGLVAQLALMGRESARAQSVFTALFNLKDECQRVCNSEPGTKLGVQVELPAGTQLVTIPQGLCASYAGRRECAACGCTVFSKGASPGLSQETILDLDTDQARRLFDSHSYRCTFERLDTNLGVECHGN